MPTKPFSSNQASSPNCLSLLYVLLMERRSKMSEIDLERLQAFRNEIPCGNTVSWHIFGMHLASQVHLCFTNLSTETLHQLPTRKAEPKIQSEFEQKLVKLSAIPLGDFFPPYHLHTVYVSLKNERNKQGPSHSQHTLSKL